MRWAALLYIALNSCFYWIGFDQRDAQQVFYQLSSVMLIAFGMCMPSRPVKFSKLNVSLGVMLAIFCLAWLLNSEICPVSEYRRDDHDNSDSNCSYTIKILFHVLPLIVR